MTSRITETDCNFFFWNHTQEKKPTDFKVCLLSVGVLIVNAIEFWWLWYPKKISEEI